MRGREGFNALSSGSSYGTFHLSSSCYLLLLRKRVVEEVSSASSVEYHSRSKLGIQSGAGPTVAASHAPDSTVSFWRCRFSCVGSHLCMSLYSLWGWLASLSMLRRTSTGCQRPPRIVISYVDPRRVVDSLVINIFNSSTTLVKLVYER